MSEENKAIVLRFIDEVQTGKNLSVVDDLFSPDLVDHDASGNHEWGARGMKDALENFFRAFPDLNVVVFEQIAEGDLVSTLKLFKGTHAGTFRGVPPSGRSVEFRVMEFIKIRTAITDHWGMVDLMTLMRQIGSGD